MKSVSCLSPCPTDMERRAGQPAAPGILVYGATPTAQLIGTPLFPFVTLTSSRSPALNATLRPVVLHVVPPVAIVQVTVVSLVLLRSVHTSSLAAVGWVFTSQ